MSSTETVPDTTSGDISTTVQEAPPATTEPTTTTTQESTTATDDDQSTTTTDDTTTTSEIVTETDTDTATTTTSTTPQETETVTATTTTPPTQPSPVITTEQHETTATSFTTTIIPSVLDDSATSIIVTETPVSTELLSNDSSGPSRRNIAIIAGVTCGVVALIVLLLLTLFLHKRAKRQKISILQLLHLNDRQNKAAGSMGLLDSEFDDDDNDEALHRSSRSHYLTTQQQQQQQQHLQHNQQPGNQEASSSSSSSHFYSSLPLPMHQVRNTGVTTTPMADIPLLPRSLNPDDTHNHNGERHSFSLKSARKLDWNETFPGQQQQQQQQHQHHQQYTSDSSVRSITPLLHHHHQRSSSGEDSTDVLGGGHVRRVSSPHSIGGRASPTLFRARASDTGSLFHEDGLRDENVGFSDPLIEGPQSSSSVDLSSIVDDVMGSTTPHLPHFTSSPASSSISSLVGAGGTPILPIAATVAATTTTTTAGISTSPTTSSPLRNQLSSTTILSPAPPPPPPTTQPQPPPSAYTQRKRDSQSSHHSHNSRHSKTSSMSSNSGRHNNNNNNRRESGNSVSTNMTGESDYSIIDYPPSTTTSGGGGSRTGTPVRMNSTLSWNSLYSDPFRSDPFALGGSINSSAPGTPTSIRTIQSTQTSNHTVMGTGRSVYYYRRGKDVGPGVGGYLDDDDSDPYAGAGGDGRDGEERMIGEGLLPRGAARPVVPGERGA